MTEPRLEQDATELTQDNAPLWAPISLELGHGPDFDGDRQMERAMLRDLAEIRKILFLQTESVPTPMPPD